MLHRSTFNSEVKQIWSASSVCIFIFLYFSGLKPSVFKAGGVNKIDKPHLGLKENPAASEARIA